MTNLFWIANLFCNKWTQSRAILNEAIAQTTTTAYAIKCFISWELSGWTTTLPAWDLGALQVEADHSGRGSKIGIFSGPADHKRSKILWRRLSYPCPTTVSKLLGWELSKKFLQNLPPMIVNFSNASYRKEESIRVPLASCRCHRSP